MIDFTLAHLRSADQISLRSFSPQSQEVTEKIVSIQDLSDLSLQSLFYPENILNDELKNLLHEQTKFYPIFALEQFNLNLDHYLEMPPTKAWSLLQQALSKWILLNNISTLEEIFHLSSYFKDLWKNDYHALFEELWFVLKNNFGSNDLKIYFHDLATNQDGKEKKSLQNVVVHGERIPNIQPANEAEDELIKNYQKHFGTSFDVIEFDLSRGHLLAVGQIMGGPILIMAKIIQFNRLQRALIKSLFEGLQDNNTND